MIGGEAHVPIVEIYGNMVVPIQVALSDRMVARLKDDIGAWIQRRNPKGLVIDVSGIDVLDSYISRTLHDIGAMARLMGIRTIISGIDPMMAMTLVEMGLPLAAGGTALTLEMAIEELRTSEGNPDANMVRWGRLPERRG